jgi:hypothetical protein
LTITIYSHIFSLEGLDDEIGNDSSIVWLWSIETLSVREAKPVSIHTHVHAWTERVKNTRHADIDAILAMEAIGQRLSYTLSFVVAGARANRVNMAPAVPHVLALCENFSLDRGTY